MGLEPRSPWLKHNILQPELLRLGSKTGFWCGFIEICVVYKENGFRCWVWILTVMHESQVTVHCTTEVVMWRHVGFWSISLSVQQFKISNSGIRTQDLMFTTQQFISCTTESVEMQCVLDMLLFCFNWQHKLKQKSDICNGGIWTLVFMLNMQDFTAWATEPVDFWIVLDVFLLTVLF